MPIARGSQNPVEAMRRSTGPQVVMTPEAIDKLPWLRMEGLDDVRHKLLWEAGTSIAGIMHIHPFGQMAPHAHEHGHHHMWVLDGHARILGQPLGIGSYVHVPAGVDHNLADVGPQGCTLFYLFIDEPGQSPAGRRARR